MPCIVPCPRRGRGGGPDRGRLLVRLPDKGGRGLKPGVPEDALHIDDDLIVAEIQFLRDPDDIVLDSQGLVVIGNGRLPALDEGGRDAASAASQHDDAHISLFAEGVELLPGLLRHFQRQSTHFLHLPLR